MTDVCVPVGTGVPTSIDTAQHTSSNRTTYKLVGDNIDKNVRPYEMTIDNQTRSLHYFHTYAVRDRVDMGNFCDDTQLPATSDIDLWNLLPTRCDDSTMRENMAILVGRILAKYMPFFSDWCKDLPRHLPHNFSCEMSQKSEVVSCVHRHPLSLLPQHQRCAYMYFHTGSTGHNP